MSLNLIFMFLFNYDDPVNTVQDDLQYYYHQTLKKGLTIKHLIVKQSDIPGAGLGVFTTKKLKKYSVIEFCHAIVYQKRGKQIKDRSISQYAYNATCSCEVCKKKGPRSMAPLGFGSIYNTASSDEQKNATYFINIKERFIAFVATRNIEKGEEILTWWGQGYYDGWCKPIANAFINKADPTLTVGR